MDHETVNISSLPISCGVFDISRIGISRIAEIILLCMASGVTVLIFILVISCLKEFFFNRHG